MESQVDHGMLDRCYLLDGAVEWGVHHLDNAGGKHLVGEDQLDHLIQFHIGLAEKLEGPGHHDWDGREVGDVFDKGPGPGKLGKLCHGALTSFWRCRGGNESP